MQIFCEAPQIRSALSATNIYDILKP